MGHLRQGGDASYVTCRVALTVDMYITLAILRPLCSPLGMRVRGAETSVRGRGFLRTSRRGISSRVGVVVVVPSGASPWSWSWSWRSETTLLATGADGAAKRDRRAPSPSFPRPPPATSPCTVVIQHALAPPGRLLMELRRPMASVGGLVSSARIRELLRTRYLSPKTVPPARLLGIWNPSQMPIVVLTLPGPPLYLLHLLRLHANYVWCAGGYLHACVPMVPCGN